MAFTPEGLKQYTKELKLLCIDDSMTARTFFQKVLGPFFKETDIAEDGDKGLLFFNKKRHDIIITDINMPGLNGIEVARFVKKISPETPVIVTTSFSEEKYLIDSIRIRIDGYIKKSANTEELLEAVYRSAYQLFQSIKIREQEKILLQQGKLSSMGELMTNIAHQWRQPINFMALSIQEIRSAFAEGELNQEYLDEVTASTMKYVQSMSQTIDQFSSYFAPETDKEDFSVRNAYEDAVGMLGMGQDQNGIKLRHNIPEDLMLSTYKKSFIQTLMNIIKNAKEAVEYTQPELKVIFIKAETVESGLGQRGVMVQICDTGGGISEEIKDKIFDPYFTTYFESQGKGLGLYITKTIVEEHLMGKLTFHNNSFTLGKLPCKGACFTMVL